MTPSNPLLPSSWRPASLSCRHRSFDDGNAVRSALVQFAETHDATGWLCTASRAGAYDPAWLVSSPENGLPLSAELFGNGVSLHLRQDGAGWRLTEWHEQPSFDGDGTLEQWSTTFAETVTHVAVEGNGVAKGARLVYHRHHAPVPEGPASGHTIAVWRPIVAIFRGFEGGAA